MKIIIKNRNWIVHENSSVEHSSTLLLSPYMQKLLFEKISSGSGLRKYFRHLLSSYGKFIISGGPDFTKSGYKIYQDKNQNLQKISFRPYTGDWLRFKELAGIAGISSTYLFSYLLMLDVMGWREKVAGYFVRVPTKPEDFTILNTLTSTIQSAIFIQKVRLLL